MRKIALLIPCHNEGQTIAAVVRAFRAQLPDADIYVFDNNSTDNTVQEARKAGAIIRYEKKQGKGNVIRSMFRGIDADIYVMVDGDGTYPADRVHDLIKPITDDEADMVIGSRLHKESKSRFKIMNLIGNKLYLLLLNKVFAVGITDLLSGYRALNSRVAKALPLLSSGFEIETELTVKCLERRHRIIEVPVDLTVRPQGSKSKINLVRDGFLILNTIIALFRDYQPFKAFGLLGLFLIFCGFIPGTVVIAEFIDTGFILRIPSAILAVGLVLSGLLVIFVGLILHTIGRRFQEIDYLMQSIIEKIRQDSSKNKSA